MFLIKEILKEPQNFKKKLKTRGFNTKVIDILVKLGNERSNTIQKVEKLKAQRNESSKKIGELKMNKMPINALLKEMDLLKFEISKLEEVSAKANEKIEEQLLLIPNLPHPNTPLGKDETQNKVSKAWRGEIKNDRDVIPHYEILQNKGLIDLKRAVKMSGARFNIFTSKGAKLARAIINFCLDENTKRGYIELSTPVIVDSQSLKGTGQLPKFSNDLFKIQDHDAWLISTGEVTLTNFHANEIVDLSKPICFTGYTESFRLEAGSAGKDTKGIIRLHEFKKVEIVKITSQNDKEKEYAKMLDDVRNLLIKLELPFREVQLCTGDLGFSSEFTTDFEVWLPSEKRFLEVSSVSMFSDFQAKRMKLRYKEEQVKYACTLNGSALPIERIITVISENFQTKNGEIGIPKVLQPYLEFTVL